MVKPPPRWTYFSSLFELMVFLSPSHIRLMSWIRAVYISLTRGLHSSEQFLCLYLSLISLTAIVPLAHNLLRISYNNIRKLKIRRCSLQNNPFAKNDNETIKIKWPPVEHNFLNASFLSKRRLCSLLIMMILEPHKQSN